MIDIFGILLTNWYAGCSLVGLIMLNGASELNDEKRRADLAINAVQMGHACAAASQTGFANALFDAFTEQQRRQQLAAAQMPEQPVGRVN